MCVTPTATSAAPTMGINVATKPTPAKLLLCSKLAGVGLVATLMPIVGAALVAVVVTHLSKTLSYTRAPCAHTRRGKH